jgi:Co/Zn/Cd efflux system component
MIGEVVGGVISNSLAIATDAAHLLTGKIDYFKLVFH